MARCYHFIVSLHAYKQCQVELISLFVSIAFENMLPHVFLKNKLQSETWIYLLEE